VVALWRYAVVPAGEALGWIGVVLVVRPVRWVYRWVLTPVGHALAWVYARRVVPAGLGLRAALVLLVR
ncbi:hypothetical protein NGM37_45230, partial [Streptomyces sp. TRM76130]|nr:hypothetical protein [Streptomyces sp. TRM76130]